MNVVPREALARVLGDVAPAPAASIELKTRAADLRMDVEGIGRISFPVSTARAAQLSELGRPARFGRRERTLTDRRVRDTWEIPKDLVTLDWSAAFGSALEAVRDGLGLPPSCRVTAELHSVLVYEPGHFFAPHQDSEKDDAMVATLVVVLPSRHTGGELVVHGHDGPTAHRGAARALTLVGFYADCTHEVRPVASGHRIALTYNLSVDGDPSGPAPDDDTAAARLADLLDAHFTVKRRHRYRDEVLDPPNRLVYLLDHEYTQRGVTWSRLKGADARRAALLKAAADSAGCDLALALAEIKETWDALEPDYQYRRRRWSDDEPDDTGPADYELQDLIDSSIGLTRWSDPAGAWAEDIALDVSEDEVCATVPTDQLRPYESEFEGYMGNYGNTMDRWYRRAALVVWPRARGFEVRAEISPLQALNEVVTGVRAAGRADKADARAAARDAVGTLAPFWHSAVRSQDQSRYLATALRGASVLDDAGTSSILLSPFRVETLRRTHLRALTTLARRHGDTWVGDLLGTWFGDPCRPGHAVTTGESRQQWLRRLPELARTLAADPAGGTAIGRGLATHAWEYLAAELDRWIVEARPSYRQTHLAPLGEPLAAVLEAAAVLQAVDLRERVFADVQHRPDEVTGSLLNALQVAEGLPADLRADAGFPELAAECMDRLRARLSRPTRADDDWSLELPAGCTCDLCEHLASFLRDAHRTSFDWPLAQARRRHVHDRIERAELPVSHTTRRQGSPYVLVLTKSADLFSRERQARAQDEAALERLTTTWDAVPRRRA